MDKNLNPDKNTPANPRTQPNGRTAHRQHEHGDAWVTDETLQSLRAVQAAGTRGTTVTPSSIPFNTDNTLDYMLDHACTYRCCRVMEPLMDTNATPSRRSAVCTRSNMPVNCVKTAHQGGPGHTRRTGVSHTSTVARRVTPTTLTNGLVAATSLVDAPQSSYKGRDLHSCHARRQPQSTPRSNQSHVHT